MAYRIQGLTIPEHLLQLAQRGNRPFTERLHPGISGVLGVRLPDLRQLDKSIIKQGDLARYLHEAEQGTSSPEEDFMEARTLHGLVLGLAPVTSLEEYLLHLERWVSKINSWSVCDCFSLPQAQKLLSQHSDTLWHFFLDHLQRREEYEVRFGVVALMQYFIDEEHIEELLKQYLEVKHEGHYVRMHSPGHSLSATSTIPRPHIPTSLLSALPPGCTTRRSKRSASPIASAQRPRRN